MKIEVDTDLEEYCRSCPDADLTIDRNILYAGDEPYITVPAISCRNLRRCRRLCRWIKEHEQQE